MTHLSPRPWVPTNSEALVQRIAGETTVASAKVAARIEALIEANLQIHDRDCFNLNPATNVMNPRAEAPWRGGSALAPASATPATSMRWGWRR